MSAEMSTYLWDGAGKKDVEVARLESLLSAYRYDKPLVYTEVVVERKRRLRWPALALVSAAALLAAAVGLALALHSNPAMWQPQDGWRVKAVAGAPRIANQSVTRTASLPVGSELATDSASLAEVKLGHIGSITVQPNSALRLVQSSGGKYFVALLHGSISARTWAPPFTFAVDTPSAKIIDLGCTFDTDVDAHGVGIVRVTSGWVQVQRDFQKALIPAGAAAKIRPNSAPGTPYFVDSSPQFQAALEKLDFGPREPASRMAALDALLPAARPRDVYTLLRLMQGAVPAERERMVDRAAQLVPFPPGVTREGVIGGNERMVDAWYEQLHLTNVKRWWVYWKDAF